jgi:hypothetical protein
VQTRLTSVLFGFSRTISIRATRMVTLTHSVATGRPLFPDVTFEHLTSDDAPVNVALRVDADTFRT